MVKILVLGASGQLGQCIRKVAENKGFNGLVFPGEAEANILDAEKLAVLFEREKPSHVVNCAAYTAVDKAEDEVDLCRAVNKEGPLNVASICRDQGVILIHVSTDFVFKGDVPELLNEEHPTEPVNVYGLTKLEGEHEIVRTAPSYFILRTSWLYSEYGNNFVKTMMRLGRDRAELNVVADQIGTPTYAIDLATVIFTIIESGSVAYGIYNYSNEGVASWYDFAKAIFDIGEIEVKVLPIPASAYPTRATRPAFSVMDKQKIKTGFNIEIPYWRDSLAACIAKLS
jgi:dTDP-4-dehydrorhamnose reductase